MKFSVFWDTTPCSPLKVNRLFGGTYLYLQISACHLVSLWFVARLILRPWRWRRYVPPKRLLILNWVHDVISQKTENSSRTLYELFDIWPLPEFIRAVTVAARSKAWNVFARSNAGIVGSNPTQGMDICLCLFCVCICSGLATGWSPIEGVLPIVLGLRNWNETKSFTDAPCSKVGATEERKRENSFGRRNMCVWCISFIDD
jgi:hypothetical protein